MMMAEARRTIWNDEFYLCKKKRTFLTLLTALLMKK